MFVVVYRRVFVMEVAGEGFLGIVYNPTKPSLGF